MFYHFNTPIAYELRRETYKHDLSSARGRVVKTADEISDALKMEGNSSKDRLSRTRNVLSGDEGGRNNRNGLISPPHPSRVILGLYQSADLTGWTLFLLLLFLFAQSHDGWERIYIYIR